MEAFVEETLRLVRAFGVIKDAPSRRMIIQIVEAAASGALVKRETKPKSKHH
jgi:hypothetical protein